MALFYPHLYPIPKSTPKIPTDLAVAVSLLTFSLHLIDVALPEIRHVLMSSRQVKKKFTFLFTKTFQCSLKNTSQTPCLRMSFCRPDKVSNLWLIFDLLPSCLSVTIETKLTTSFRLVSDT